MERLSFLRHSILPGRKHSNRIKRRLFDTKKVFLEKKLPELIKLQKNNGVPENIEPLQYVGTHKVDTWLPNGWCPKPADPESPDLPRYSLNLPFQVSRTEKGGFLPVYSDYKRNYTQPITIVRKIKGDKTIMAKELSKVCNGKDVKIRAGSLEVKGLHTQEVREWLASFGF